MKKACNQSYKKHSYLYMYLKYFTFIHMHKKTSFENTATAGLYLIRRLLNNMISSIFRVCFRRVT